MSQSERQLWMDRISRALAELKKEPSADHNSQTDPREQRQEPDRSGK
jgi:hypothetical protein